MKKNITKDIEGIISTLNRELKGGLYEPLGGERLMHISRELRNVAIHVFAHDLSDALPSKANTVRWNGWFGEEDDGSHGHYVDDIEIVFVINGMAYGLPVFHDFFDWDSANFTLISYLADMPVSNIEDAERAISFLNENEEKIIKIKPDSIEDFCKLAFIHSSIEEWVLEK